jgi:excisionase family DNA binding protein
MVDVGTLLAQLFSDPKCVDGIEMEAIPEALGELERLKALLLVRLSVSANAQAVQAQVAPQPDDRLLTISELATILSVPRSYAYELCRRGDIPSVRFGGRYVRVALSSLRVWMTQHQTSRPLS